jgi:CHAT domain-containing protein/Tfp pilus assembly protein PilF
MGCSVVRFRERPRSTNIANPLSCSRGLLVLPLVLIAIGLRAQDQDREYTITADLTAHSQVDKQLKTLLVQLDDSVKSNDRKREAAVSNKLGLLYTSLGQIDNALRSYTRVLEITKEVHDRHGEVIAINNIAGAYEASGRFEMALKGFQEALESEVKLKERKLQATTLNNIAGTYVHLGEQKKAMDYFKQSANLSISAGDKRTHALALYNLGALLREAGKPQEALKRFDEALVLFRKVRDRRDEAFAEDGLGITYLDLGSQSDAMAQFASALRLQQKIQDVEGSAITLNNIADSFSGGPETKVEFLNESLRVFHAQNDRMNEALCLNNLATVYASSGDMQRSMELSSQALRLARELRAPSVEASSLASLGAAELDLNHDAIAFSHLTDALSLSTAVREPLLQARILFQLAKYCEKSTKPMEAIFFLKQAVGTYQQVRTGIQGIDRGLQRSFLRSISGSYRRLADLLISEGRLPEARQVLDLLKEQEFKEFVRGDSGAETGTVSLTAEEETAAKNLKERTDQITKMGEQWSELQHDPSRTPDEEAQFQQLSAQLKQANKEMEVFFQKLYESLGGNDPANRTMEAAKDASTALQSLIGQLGPGTVALYTLVAEDRCWVIVITPTVMVARESPIKSEELRRKVFAFGEDLRNRQSDPRASAEALYKVLVGPVEDDLKGANAQTLVWSLDDVLRYVPMAALYDGKQYLVERYSNVVVTPRSLSSLKDQPNKAGLVGLAMGISKKYEAGLSELPAVPQELNGIVHDPQHPGSRGALAGVIELDDEFTEKAMAEQLNKPQPLIHIASHFVFRPGNDTNSYLLLSGKDVAGTGYHLTMEELRDDPRLRFNGTELLTLSACDTASSSSTADGREVDGLETIAHRNGAKAVLASLWSANDATTGQLMVDFYQRWVGTAGNTKSEALKQAQLDLFQGKTFSAGTKSTAVASRPAPTPSTVSPGNYSHPYYWAPFILMGNWN